MPAMVEVITEKDIRDLAYGLLEGEQRDAVATFVERDAEANAMFRAILQKNMSHAEPSERLICRTEQARQAEITGTARRVLIFSLGLVVTALAIAGVLSATV